VSDYIAGFISGFCALLVVNITYTVVVLLRSRVSNG